MNINWAETLPPPSSQLRSVSREAVSSFLLFFSHPFGGADSWTLDVKVRSKYPVWFQSCEFPDVELTEAELDHGRSGVSNSVDVIEICSLIKQRPSLLFQLL